MPLFRSINPVENSFTFLADCSVSELVGDLVRISADPVAEVFQVRKVDATDPAKMPAVGIVINKPSSTTCVVAYHGVIDSLVVLTPGKPCFVSASSTLTSTPPSAPVILQIVGVAYASDKAFLSLLPNMMRLT